jgi:hypothetical protein
MWPFNRKARAARSRRRNDSGGTDEAEKKSSFYLPGTRDEILEKYKYRC